MNQQNPVIAIQNPSILMRRTAIFFHFFPVFKFFFFFFPIPVDNNNDDENNDDDDDDDDDDNDNDKIRLHISKLFFFNNT